MCLFFQFLYAMHASNINFQNYDEKLITILFYNENIQLINKIDNRSSRVISLRPERSLSRGFPSLELDTVVEERSSDHEQTQTDILSPESPVDPSNYRGFHSSS